MDVACDFHGQDPLVTMPSGTLKLYGPLLEMTLRVDNVAEIHSYRLVATSEAEVVRREDEVASTEDDDDDNSEDESEDREEGVASTGDRGVFFDPDTVLTEVKTAYSDFATLMRATKVDDLNETAKVDVPVHCLLLGKQRMVIVEGEEITEMPSTLHSIVLARSVDYPDRFTRIGLMRTESDDYFGSCISTEVTVM